jgi:DNA polymerase elongation subunit (family B)
MQVPIVRVFGETPGGQKACLHIHDVFPYLYVPYDDDLPKDAVSISQSPHSADWLPIRE